MAKSKVSPKETARKNSRTETRVAQKRKAKPKEVTLAGLIMAAEWDEEDEVIGLNFVTEDEEEYILVRNPIHDELLDYVDEEVELTGTISEDEDGSLLFESVGFEVLGDIDSDDDEDEEEEDEFEHDYLEDEKEDEDEDDDYR